MTNFIKYPSIENHDNSKHIAWFLKKYPELLDEQYIIQEKIHGANIQFIFSTKQQYVVASRNNKSEDDFYDYKKIIQNNAALQITFTKLQNYVDQRECELNLYGEIFGPTIQKGVYYGDEKQIRFFDLKLNGVWVPPSVLHNFISKNLCVPTLSFADSLTNALDFDVERNSAITNKENNLLEGIVLKPFKTTYLDGHGYPFYIKKKNKKFREISRIKKVRIKKVEIPEITALRKIFEAYINENRMNNIESNYGKIESEKDIGKYLGLLMKDSYDDFYKDNEQEFSRVCGLYTTAKKVICKTSTNAINIVKNRVAAHNDAGHD